MWLVAPVLRIHVSPENCEGPPGLWGVTVSLECVARAKGCFQKRRWVNSRECDELRCEMIN